MNQEIIDYIRQQRMAGHSDQAIADELKKGGWQDAQINEAFAAASGATMAAPMATGRPYTVGELFSHTFARYKHNFWTYIGVELLPVICLFLTGVLAVFLKDNSLIIVLFVVFILLFIIGQFAMVVASVKGDQKIGVFRSYGIAFRRFFSFLWINILVASVGFALIGIRVIVYVISKIFGSATIYDAGGLFSGLNIILGLLFLAGIVFAIYFGIRFNFSNYVMVNEDLRGTKALLKSSYYVKGNMLRVIGWGILLLIIAIAASLVSAALSKLLPTDYQAIIPALFNLVLTPFYVNYVTEMYLGIKQSKPDIMIVPTAGQKVWFSVAVILTLVVIISVLFMFFSFFGLLFFGNMSL